VAAFPEQLHEPNRLIRWIFIFSFIVHILIFFYVSVIYKKNELSVIELSLQQMLAPSTRSIPRPKLLKNLPEINPVNALDIADQTPHAPDIDPSEIQTEKLPTEDVISAVPGQIMANVPILGSGGAAAYLTQNDYVDVLRLKIESRKKYPEDARKKHIEGKVLVRFLITRDGQLSSLQVVKGSGHKQLDQAALKAVEDAAPFSAPPSNLFNGPLHLELSIVFEIM